jgi:hypothetical protein
MNLIIRMTIIAYSCFNHEIVCEVTMCLQDELLQLFAGRRPSPKTGQSPDLKQQIAHRQCMFSGRTRSVIYEAARSRGEEEEPDLESENPLRR